MQRKKFKALLDKGEELYRTISDKFEEIEAEHMPTRIGNITYSHLNQVFLALALVQEKEEKERRKEKKNRAKKDVDPKKADG